VANEYSYKKNIVMSSNNNKLKISTYQKDKLTVYLNFNVTTNYLERQWIKDFFDNKKWVEIEDNLIEIEEYRKKVIDSTFVMCPPGNGTETHRMWEALFLGSIPIVKNHITYKNIQDLPVFFVDDFKEVSEDSLNKFLKSLTKKPDLNLDKLSILYWHQEIQNKSIQTNRQLVVSESRIITKYFQIRSNIITKAKSNSKKVKFYLRKVKTIKNKVLKNRKN
ncbi:glycosyltransferase family 47 protein, partial [Acidimicrobiia bacterium]|nr:glycosyltransferase family 47 protein [Acidimicrobiia bacterium]